MMHAHPHAQVLHNTSTVAPQHCPPRPAAGLTAPVIVKRADDPRLRRLAESRAGGERVVAAPEVVRRVRERPRVEEEEDEEEQGEGRGASRAAARRAVREEEESEEEEEEEEEEEDEEEIAARRALLRQRCVSFLECCVCACVRVCVCACVSPLTSVSCFFVLFM
jgi:hypothetical protein